MPGLLASPTPAATSPRCAPPPSARVTSWSSTARRSGPALGPTRTGSSRSCAPTCDAPKHQGITFVMIDMHSPGIEARPIRQINGDAGFAEVFFSDVRVPVENVVGQLDDGWRVAMATLGFERGTGLGVRRPVRPRHRGAGRHRQGHGPRHRPALPRPRHAGFRRQRGLPREQHVRTLTALAAGQAPGPEASLNKLYWSEMEARIFETGMDAMGELAELTPTSDAGRGSRALAEGVLVLARRR